MWNGAPLLPRALASALGQTLGDLEAIVVDDGSTDDSAEVAERAGDPRVRVVRAGRRAGVSAARNRGIAEARADVVAFLDADDEWLPEKLERQVALLRAAPESPPVVYCAFERSDALGGRVLGRAGDGPQGDVYRPLLTGWHPGTASVFAVTRAALEAVGGFDEQLLTAEDYDLWLRLARAGHRFGCVPDVLAIKHERAGPQLTRDPAARRLSQRRLEARWAPVIAAELGEPGYRAWRADRRVQLAAAYLEATLEAADRGHRRTALVSATHLVSLLPASSSLVPAGLAAAVLGRRGYRMARRVRRATGGAAPAGVPSAAEHVQNGVRTERAAGLPGAAAVPAARSTAADADRHTFVFICGLHRSGTSLLFDLLRSHPQVSGFRDTGVPRDEGQHLQTVYPAPGTHGRPGQFGWNPAAHLTEASPLVTRANRDTLFAQWARYWDTSRPYLLEKSPPNLIRSRFFQALFPRSKFVVLRRHPVPVALSTRRWTPVPLYSLVHHWVFCHERWAADRPFVREAIEITYEALVTEPAATLRAITDFLGAVPFARVPVRPDPAVNGRYFDLWAEIKERPRGRLALGLTELRFDRRIRRWGYSFRFAAPGNGTAPRVPAADAARR